MGSGFRMPWVTGSICAMRVIARRDGTQQFAGKIYHWDGHYFIRIRSRLHRVVYEWHHGRIPKGYHVHHVDEDRRNNQPGNLALMAESAHRKLHMLQPERREVSRRIMAEKALPAAREWHRSPEGRAWHRQNYLRVRDKFHAKRKRKCRNCGTVVLSHRAHQDVYCAATCRSAFRRRSGCDDETRHCEHCKKAFRINKHEKQKCCSQSCSALHWRRQRRA